MPDRDTLLLFMAATLALNLTPGPDMLYVIGRSMAGGLRSGVVSALGISGGILIHIGALAAGVATLLAATPIAFNTIRIAGAAYLIWLGIGALRHARVTLEAPAVGSATTAVLFVQGVLTSLLNPKIALFFLALLPQFADPARGNTIHQLVILGLLFVTSGTLVNVVVAMGVAQSVSRVTRRNLGAARMTVHLKRATGVLFILLGLRMALQ